MPSMGSNMGVSVAFSMVNPKACICHTPTCKENHPEKSPHTIPRKLSRSPPPHLTQNPKMLTCLIIPHKKLAGRRPNGQIGSCWLHNPPPKTAESKTLGLEGFGLGLGSGFGLGGGRAENNCRQIAPPPLPPRFLLTLSEICPVRENFLGCFMNFCEF